MAQVTLDLAVHRLELCPFCEFLRDCGKSSQQRPCWACSNGFGEPTSGVGF
jgi:hypothetical protein